MEMRKDQELTWAQMALAANAPMMTKAAMVDGDSEVGILPHRTSRRSDRGSPAGWGTSRRIMGEADEVQQTGSMNSGPDLE